MTNKTNQKQVVAFFKELDKGRMNFYKTENGFITAPINVKNKYTKEDIDEINKVIKLGQVKNRDGVLYHEMIDHEVGTMPEFTTRFIVRNSLLDTGDILKGMSIRALSRTISNKFNIKCGASINKKSHIVIRGYNENPEAKKFVSTFINTTKDYMNAIKVEFEGAGHTRINYGDVDFRDIIGDVEIPYEANPVYPDLYKQLVENCEKFINSITDVKEVKVRQFMVNVINNALGNLESLSDEDKKTAEFILNSKWDFLK